jgi:2-polyprenyl-3-methyl-5-hydroxy-6-metoxy-1,4-benzoquinol methylase
MELNAPLTAQSEAETAAASTISVDLQPPATPKAGACLLCGAGLVQTETGLFDTRFGIDGIYSFARCQTCELEQIQPLPTGAHLKHLYESHYNFGSEKGTLYTKLRERFLSSFAYQWWCRLDGDISFHTRVGKGRLLDVGCNEGRGLRIYSRHGFQAEGLELNETAAGVARRAGFAVETVSLSEFQPRALYDVVILSNVLEHALNPVDMLKDVARLLKPRGQVWVSCPNGKSWMRNIFRSSWINWHIPFHISQFSTATLNKVLTQAGFKTVESTQITPALWVASSVIAALFAKEGRVTRELRNPILVLCLLVISRFLFFPALWLGNRLGRGDCHLLLAAKC